MQGTGRSLDGGSARDAVLPTSPRIAAACVCGRIRMCRCIDILYSRLPQLYPRNPPSHASGSFGLSTTYLSWTALHLEAEYIYVALARARAFLASPHLIFGFLAPAGQQLIAQCTACRHNPATPKTAKAVTSERASPSISALEAHHASDKASALPLRSLVFQTFLF